MWEASHERLFLNGMILAVLSWFDATSGIEPKMVIYLITDS